MKTERQVGSGEEYQQPHEISVLHRKLMKRMDVDGRVQTPLRNNNSNSNSNSNSSNSSNNNDAIAAATAAIINRVDAAKSPNQEPSEQVTTFQPSTC